MIKHDNFNATVSVTGTTASSLTQLPYMEVCIPIMSSLLGLNNEGYKTKILFLKILKGKI